MQKFIDDGRVLAGQTTREGGVSEGAYASLNLAFHVGDDPLAVAQNREILRERLGAQKLVFMEQIHGTNAREITKETLAGGGAVLPRREIQTHNSNLNTENLARASRAISQSGGSRERLRSLSQGAALPRREITKETLANNSNLNYDLKGADNFNSNLNYGFIDAPKCDAVFTSLPNVALCVMVADCSPVLIYDRARGVVAAAHAGRAGVCGRIVSKTLRAMGSRGEDVEIWVGARILGGCYEIGDLDLGEFSRFASSGRFDMSAALRAEFEELGVRRAHFEEICAHCDPRFFSYRKERVCGRFCGFIMLRN